MAKFGRFKFGQAKFGTKPITPWDPNITYHGRPVALEVRGDINKESIYRICQGHQFKYPYFVPANPQTELQQENRATFAEASTAASALTPEEREPYKERAWAIGNIYWHNIFIRDYMQGAKN
ncbi:hypothetical protein ES703_54672 [subsurface metagenome]